ncbi:NAD-dependent epimerase/dehydratase family protein [Stutzerimonas stutzeri]|nr:NAD-dependent epimerase/dehydratase family protein [Stutzerimonas stutzeri]RRV40459.1 NAD-dependent epimerase/dehydratase family protein [Stutzerimonas stutzeri]
MRILLTGSSGFVGSALAQALAERPLGELVLPVRSVVEGRPAIGEIGAATDWSALLDGVEVVVHCAARVHVMRETDADPLAAFRAVNVQGTLRLAESAAAAGVRRFIFLSSVKVHGEASGERPFRASDPPAPADAYGLSKLEAEQGLRELSARTGMELVIIRPPLVYGPGVKANFRSMMRWLARGVPLPLGAIHNRRSLVALDNLVDLIRSCITHPQAAGQIFLVSDGEDLSTSELLRRLGRALANKRTPTLFC